MQTQRDAASMLDTARKVLVKEGIRGLYRGAGAVSLGSVPTQWIYVTVLETARSRVRQVVAGSGHEQVERMVAASVAGGIASCGSAALGVPLDVVTQRMQIGGPQDTLVNVVKSVWKNDGGIRGFYRGYWASLLVFAPTSSVWWTTYSNTCVLLGKDDRDSYSSTMWRTMLAGFTAGVTAAVCTNPLDVIKTRLQTQKSGVSARSYLQLARELYAAENWRGFFRGATARCSAMAPTSIMMIFSYETVKRFSKKK